MKPVFSEITPSSFSGFTIRLAERVFDLVRDGLEPRVAVAQPAPRFSSKQAVPHQFLFQTVGESLTDPLVPTGMGFPAPRKLDLLGSSFRAIHQFSAPILDLLARAQADTANIYLPSALRCDSG